MVHLFKNLQQWMLVCQDKHVETYFENTKDYTLTQKTHKKVDGKTFNHKGR